MADIRAIELRIREDIRRHRSWYDFQGGLFLLLGFVTIILPVITVLSATLFLGGLFLITGISQLISSLRSRMHWWSLLSALLSIAVGGWMLLMPFEGVLALALAIAFFLLIEGGLEILLALRLRPAPNWGWMLASGAVTLALVAVLLWSGWPVSSTYFLAMLIAINFILYGTSILMMAASV